MHYRADRPEENRLRPICAGYAGWCCCGPPPGWFTKIAVLHDGFDQFIAEGIGCIVNRVDTGLDPQAVGRTSRLRRRTAHVYFLDALALQGPAGLPPFKTPGSQYRVFATLFSACRTWYTGWRRFPGWLKRGWPRGSNPKPDLRISYEQFIPQIKAFA